MAKRQPSLLEALQLLGLGQEQVGPQQEPPKPIGPEPPRRFGELDVPPQPPQQEAPAGGGPNWLEKLAAFVGKQGAQAVGDLGQGAAIGGDVIRQIAQQEGLRQAENPVFKALGQGPAIEESQAERKQADADASLKGVQDERRTAAEGEVGKLARTYLDEIARRRNPAPQPPNMAGVREQTQPARYQAQDPLGRIQMAPELDPVAMIQRGVNEPLAPPVGAVKELDQRAPQPTFEDMELQALAKKAGEYKKPGVLEALAVLANSINPRQTPQGSMQFAQLVRGEPERRSAEAMLGQLTQARGRRQAEEARQGGQLAVEGLRQGGATERAKIGAGARLGAAQIGQQGLLQRTEMQGQTARDVAALRGAGGDGGLSPNEEINQIKFATRNISTPYSNVKADLERLSFARQTMDPATYQAQEAALIAKRDQLGGLLQQALGMMVNTNQISPALAMKFMIAEGIPLPGVSPEVDAELKKYGDSLRGALGR